jgi:hypothetical protein
MPPPYPTSGLTDSGLTDSLPVSASFGQGQTSNPCSGKGRSRLRVIEFSAESPKLFFASLRYAGELEPATNGTRIDLASLLDRAIVGE